MKPKAKKVHNNLSIAKYKVIKDLNILRESRSQKKQISLLKFNMNTIKELKRSKIEKKNKSVKINIVRKFMTMKMKNYML